MRLGYSLFIALRYLGSRRRKGLSFNTLVSIGGVALGVCTLLVVLAVMSGFHQDLQEKILGVNAHVVVLGAQGPLQNYQALAQALRQRPQVLSASPFVLGQVMLARGGAAQGVYLRGVLPSEAQAEMGRFMKEGSLSALAQRHEGLAGIVLGRELALRLGAFQGDVLRLLSPRMELGPLGMLPKVREFRVAGVFEVGMFEYDSNLALVSLQAAQEFFGLGDRVTGLQLRLRDIYQAPQLARTLQEQLGYTVVVRDWVQMNRSLFAALKLEKLAMFVILVLIILVAAFNIVSTLMMTVLQKERDIAILRAMGASRRGIMGVFMLQGLLIGLVGTAIGLAGGLGLSYLLDAYQLIKLPPDVYYLSHLPARINVGDFLLVSASALLIAFLATLWPAWQAASTSPIEPLRYE